MEDATLLAQLLPAVLSHDNDVRRAAEAQLNDLSLQPGFLPALMALLLAPDAAECQRQLAATVLSWRVGALWASLAADQRTWLMDGALTALGSVREAASRRAAAELLNVVAQCCASDEAALARLIAAVGAAATSGEASHRASAASVLAALTESLGARLLPHHSAIAALLPHSLGAEVACDARAAAARVAAALGDSWCLTEEAAACLRGGALPLLLAAASQAGGDAACEAADEAALAALGACARLLLPCDVTHLAAVALRRAAQSDVRHAARLSFLTLLTRLAEADADSFAPDAPACASALWPLCWADDEDDEDARQLAGAAQDTLGCLSAVVPERAGLALPILRAISDSCAAGDARAAPQAAPALRALAAVCDSCRGVVRSSLPELLPALCVALGPQQLRRVRCAAAHASLALVAAFPAALGDDVGLLLAAAAAAAGGDPCARQRARCARLIARMAPEMATDELAPHVGACVTALLPLLLSADTHTATAAADALGEVACAACDLMEPYAAASLGALSPLLCSDAATCDARLRAAATATAGAVLACASAELRAAAWPGAHAAAAQGYASGRSELREAALRFLSRLARAEDTGFAPLLPGAVAAALAAAADAVAEAASSAAAAVRTGSVEEAAAAAEALGCFAAATEAAFLPFLSDALRALDALLSHPLPAVRGPACRALAPALAPLRSPAARADADSAAAAAQLACGVLARLARLIADDPDSQVVADACGAAADVAHAALSSGIAHSQQAGRTVRATLESLDAVILGAARCQADAAGDQEDEDEDDAAAELANAANDARESLLASVARDTAASESEGTRAT